MLVKLGNVWIDPIKVEGCRVNCSLEEGNKTYLGSEHSFSVSIFTAAESGIIAAFCPTVIDANALRDEYAAIINNAVGQTYGGADEETGTPTS